MVAEKLQDLRDFHMPPLDLAATIADLFAALAIGLLSAWLIFLLVRVTTKRHVPPETLALQRLEAIGPSSSGNALAERAAILQDYAATIEGDADWMTRVDERLGGIFSEGAGRGLRDALYRPGASLDVAGFDLAVKAALDRAGR